MTYSLQFTERMIGAFTFAESDYVAGYQVGQQNGTGLQFHLTIATGDVHAMIANCAHPAIPQGYVKCDALGGRLPVQQGTFALFVAEGSTTRHMLYRLYFSDSTGRHLTLTGFKDVSPGPLRAIWAETSTLLHADSCWACSGHRRRVERHRWDRRFWHPSHQTSRFCLATHDVPRTWTDLVGPAQSFRRVRRHVSGRTMAGVQSDS